MLNGVLSVNPRTGIKNEYIRKKIKMVQQKSYKFRIYPNKTQEVLLNKTFGCVRYAWNSWVSLFNNKEVENKDKHYNTPKEFRQVLNWMQEISSASLQQKERDFISFKKQFFNKKRKKRLGSPSFKSKHKRQSYRLTNRRFAVLYEEKQIRLEKIGRVKAVFDRVIPEGVKFLNVTVSKDLCGSYFVSVLVEENIVAKAKTNKEVGIDVGLKNFAIMSSGEIVANPKFFRENQSKLKRLQQHFSRKVKGSARRSKTKLKIAKLHRTIGRQRDYFLHCLSTYLVTNFDMIGIEDLNVSGMIKNHKLAKSIADASWSKFFSQLTYKSSWYGKELVKIGRFFPSSKTCTVCGWRKSDLKLSDREFICECCGVAEDRDINASKNILKESVRVSTELQTWRDRKTLSKASTASPCEALKVL